MRKFLTVCAITACLAPMTVMAQTDAKAKTILDAASKKMNGLKSLKATFSLKLKGGKGGKVNESKKGTISLKGQKYHLDISGQEIFCDAKTMWTYNKDAKEVTINTYNPNEQSVSPAKLLSNFYDKEYSYKYAGEKKEAGKSVDVIELSPKDKGKQVSKIELFVDKGNSMIAGGNIFEKNGTKLSYSVTNITPNVNLTDGSFIWDTKAHPGVEVNDLR